MTQKHEFPNSISINNCIYDPSTKNMTIEFTSGAKYRYQDVEQKVFDEFKIADSVGTYFYTKIRRNYKSERLED